MVSCLVEGVSPVLSLGEFDHGSAPVYFRRLVVGRVSRFADRFQFFGFYPANLNFSALGDTWIEAVASWFCLAAVAGPDYSLFISDN